MWVDLKLTIFPSFHYCVWLSLVFIACNNFFLTFFFVCSGNLSVWCKVRWWIEQNREQIYKLTENWLGNWMEDGMEQKTLVVDWIIGKVSLIRAVNIIFWNETTMMASFEFLWGLKSSKLSKVIKFN